MAVSYFEEVSGNIIIRRVHMSEAGDIVDGHAHKEHHVSYFMQGTAKVEFKKQAGWINIKTGKMEEVNPPSLLIVKQKTYSDELRKFMREYRRNLIPVEPFETIIDVPLAHKREDGKVVGYIKGVSAYECKVLINRLYFHKITALSPHVHFHCIYSMKDPDTNEVVGDWNGYMECAGGGHA